MGERKTLLDWALESLSRGWAVFPCKPRSKEPLASLAPTGVKDATKDEAIVREWWRKEPNANPAIALGPSNLTVLDADDGLPDAIAAREWIKNCQIPVSLIVRTGRRTSYGLQIYYEGLSENHPYRHQGVAGEVRSAGYYVMAPGAVHDKSGETYQILRDQALTPIPDIVKRLTKLALPRPQGDSDEKIEPTERHYFIVERCRELHFAGLAGKGLKTAVRWLYENRCVRDAAKDQRVFSDGELDDIADWVEAHKPQFPLEPRDFITMRFAAKDDKLFQAAWDGNLLPFDGDREKAATYMAEKLKLQRVNADQIKRICGASRLEIEATAPPDDYPDELRKTLLKDAINEGSVPF